MGDSSPIPPGVFFKDKKRGSRRVFLLFWVLPYISIYIIKKVPKTRANAVFPDAREGLEAKGLTRFQADLFAEHS